MVECKHKAFKKTEAKTYILFIKNEKPSENYFFDFVSVNSCAEIERVTTVKVKDYFPQIPFIKNVESSRFKIIRGTLSGKLCKELSHDFIHTTNMKKDMECIKFASNSGELEFKQAIPGDVIISRVGTRVLGKTNFVINGSAILSDCVFAIRFLNKDDKETFISYWRECRDYWIETNATGTCARHITKTNLSKLIDSLLE